MLLSKDVALVEGVLAFAVLIALQFVIAWLSVRSAMVRRLVKSEPTLLWHQGTWLPEAMAAERVTRGMIGIDVVGEFLSVRFWVNRRIMYPQKL